MADNLKDEAERRDAAASAYGVSYATVDDAAEGEQDDSRRDRRLPSIIALVLLILALVLLLMLRNCDFAGDTEAAGGRSIEAVPDRSPVPGSVSVWVASGTTIDAVLSASRIQSTSRTNMGEGRWVIQVREGSEERVISALREHEAVYDAGLVYDAPLEGVAGP